MDAVTDVAKLAAERVLKARAELITSRVFYGVLVANVQPVPSRSIPTMATNGKQHFYNPDFVVALTQEQLLAVQAHESEHDARHHSTRRAGRDPEKWNEACDYAINGDLLNEGFKLPGWVLQDKRFTGMSAEDIYRIRELEQQAAEKAAQEQAAEQEKQDEQSVDQEAGDEAGDQEAGDEAGDQEAGDEAGDQEAGDEAGDQEAGDEAGDQEAGDEAGEADVSRETSASGEPTDEPGEDGREGDSQDDGEPTDEAGEASGAGENGEETPQEAGEPKSCGDPGQCGEVLDAGETPADIADAEAHWEVVTRQAEAMAKKAGQLPGHITREIERRLTPTQDWREVLRAWIDQGAQRVSTWDRPNRRFAGRGLTMPGSQPDGTNKVVMLIDTSGSMDEVALRCVNTEVQAALDEGAINEVVVVYGDTEVTRIDEYVNGDQMTFDPRGSGGTEMEPLFKFAEDQHSDASLIICFTDLRWYSDVPEPASQVLFAVTGYPQVVREMLKRTPWNAPGIDVGEH